MAEGFATRSDARSWTVITLSTPNAEGVYPCEWCAERGDTTTSPTHHYIRGWGKDMRFLCDPCARRAFIEDPDGWRRDEQDDESQMIVEPFLVSDLPERIREVEREFAELAPQLAALIARFKRVSDDAWNLADAAERATPEELDILGEEVRNYVMDWSGQHRLKGRLHEAGIDRKRVEKWATV